MAYKHSGLILILVIPYWAIFLSLSSPPLLSNSSTRYPLVLSIQVLIAASLITCEVGKDGSSIVFEFPRVAPESDRDLCGPKNTKIFNNETCIMIGTICEPNGLEFLFRCGNTSRVCSCNFTLVAETSFNVSGRIRLKVRHLNITYFIWFDYG